MALQVPKVFKDNLVLHVVKHLLGMVLEVGLAAIYKRVPRNEVSAYCGGLSQSGSIMKKIGLGIQKR